MFCTNCLMDDNGVFLRASHRLRFAADQQHQDGFCHSKFFGDVSRYLEPRGPASLHLCNDDYAMRHVSHYNNTSSTNTQLLSLGSQDHTADATKPAWPCTAAVPFT